jgi:hypothetical protein
MRAALCAVAFLLAGCGAGAERYPADYQTNFVQACQMNGSAEAHCQCVWAKVESEIPVTEFVAADAVLQAGQEHPIRAQILSFHEACRAAP